MKAVNIVGSIFGRLTVVERSENNKFKARWLCRCECGKRKVVDGTLLRSGHTQSCGCLAIERRTKHGGTAGYVYSKEYTAWKHMVSRCTSVKDPAWSDYGGRGITVCEPWRSFATFLKDMGNAPSPDMSLDRIDNDVGYGPSNCRWATRGQQAANKRGSVVVNIDGFKECLAHACRRYGTAVGTAKARIRRGWTERRAITEAPQK